MSDLAGHKNRAAADPVHLHIPSSNENEVLKQSMSTDSPNKLLQKYLEDIIAAEKSFESQLRAMAGEVEYAPAKELFARHADETRTQYERLTQRLEQLGGKPSALKAAAAHIFNFTPKAAQIGHESSEKATQNLIIAFTVENSEVATYEALATVAIAAGDYATERLAREIQEEERRASHHIWHLIAPSSREAFDNVLRAA
jgi:ferritin-like metal-binding protein YciE